MKKHGKKLLIGVVCFVAVGIVGNFLFEILMGAVLRDTYTYVIVPENRYVSWEELQDRPADIGDEHTLWFDDLVEPESLEQLSAYMQDKQLFIAPGEYHIAGVKKLDTLKERLEFMSKGSG